GGIRAVSGAGQTSKSTDRGSRSDFANGAVVGVGYIDVVCAVYRESGREVKPCGAAGAIGAASAAGQTGKSAHHASGSDFADGAVVGIGDEDIADTVDGHSDGKFKAGGAASAIGAAGA